MSPFRFLQFAARATWFQTAFAGALGTAILIVLYIAAPPILTRLDLKTYDMLLPLRASSAPSRVPFIVDIDERSLEKYGQWPWPRYLMADLVNALKLDGVSATGFDIMFAERDKSSPEEMRARLMRDKKIAIAFDGLPEDMFDYDHMFGEALRETNSVLAAYARAGAGVDLPNSVNVIAHGAKGASDFQSFLQSFESALLPEAVLREVSPVGVINFGPDYDGVIRQIPLLLRAGDKIYPALALRTLMRALGTENLTVGYGRGGLEYLTVGSCRTSLTPHGSIYIPFIGPRGVYEYISAADILDGSLAPGSLEGRVAFVGTSAPGLMDMRTTPYDDVYPGVEVHAAVLDALLTGNAIVIPAFSSGLQFLCVLFVGFIATVAYGFARPRAYIMIASALIISAAEVSRFYFVRGIFISPLYVILTVVTLGGLLLFVRFWQEENQKILLRNTFSRYVSPEIVRRITKERGDFFAGEERELSILFTDIRGFTSVSEKLPPDQIVRLLNRYFTPMTAIVRERSGTLDKFIGDALMAFWNAPLEVSGHPALAVEAAIAMQEKLGGMNAELLYEFGVALRIGAGIHTGRAYVGNMGTEDLVNYTLIGDNVNMASRIEGLCPQYGLPIMASGDTLSGCGGTFEWQYIDTINVKGKSRSMSVYTPLAPGEEKFRALELANWREACDLYLAGNFAECREILRVLEIRFPESKLYSVYRERTEQLLKTPPSDWNGVWTFTSH